MTRPARKPTVTDKLIAWKQAYDALLAEVREDPFPSGNYGKEPVNIDTRASVARTAALLIQGTDYGDDRA